MKKQGQDYSADAIPSSPFLPLPPITPAPESRPPVAPVVARLPHLGDAERLSILPIRHDSHCPIEAAESIESAGGIECIKVAEWNIFSRSRLWERSRWLRERLVHDRLLLGSWICIAVLGGITVSDFIGEHFFPPTKKTNVGDDAAWVFHETPWTEETAAKNTAITREERPTNPFAAVTIDDRANNLPTDSIAQSWADAATPWDKPATSAYSPWNVAPMKPVPSEVATTNQPNTGLLSTEVYHVAAYEPTGFSGYDPAAPFAAVPTEREIPMRPAMQLVTPIASSPIPVTESRQTFRHDTTPPPAQAGSGYPRW